MVLPLIVIYTVSSIGGIGGGWISSNFIKKGKSIDFARKTTILMCALIVLPVMLVSQVANLWVAVILISLAAAGHQGWASNIFTIVSDIYPKNAVGSMIGMSGFMGAIGGALSAAFVGRLLEGTGSYFLIFLILLIAIFTNITKGEIMAAETKLEDGLYAKFIISKGKSLCDPPSVNIPHIRPIITPALINRAIFQGF